MQTAGRRRRRIKRRGGSFINRLVVPAALFVGQKSMHATHKRNKKHKKGTRKGMRRKTARRAYM
jgi:hypothetical protein